MARINVEDSLWADPRFLRLCIALGSEATAAGAVLLAWRVAQNYWVPGRRLIPINEFKRKLTERIGTELIASGLTEEREVGLLYVSGSEKQFAWLEQRSEAGRGNKGKSNKRRRTESNENKRVRSSSSSSSSFSLSSSDSSSISDSKEKEGAAKPNAGAFIGAYCSAWKERYGTRPEITGKEQGIAKRLAGSIGTERLSELVESFLHMNDSWFVQKRHDLATFEANLNAVVQYHDTGKSITRGEIAAADRMQTNVNAFAVAAARIAAREKKNG